MTIIRIYGIDHHPPSRLCDIEGRRRGFQKFRVLHGLVQKANGCNTKLHQGVITDVSVCYTAKICQTEPYPAT